MNRKTFQRMLAALVPVIPLLFFMTSVARGSTGVLLTVKGDVIVTVNRVSQPAKTGFRVGPGAKVVSRGGSVTLLLSDGKAHTVRDGASYTLPGDEPEEGPDPLILGLMDVLRELVSRGKAPSTEPEPRAETEIPAFYPCNSLVPPGEIRFEWEPAAGAESYEINLRAPLPAYAYSFVTGSAEGRAVLPKEAPPLLPGIRYYWKVRPSGTLGDEAFSSALHWFALLEPGEEVRRRLESERLRRVEGLDEESRGILTACHLTAYGLYHEGVNLFLRRLRSHPEDAGARELLRGIYGKMNKPEGLGKVK